MVVAAELCCVFAGGGGEFGVDGGHSGRVDWFFVCGERDGVFEGVWVGDADVEGEGGRELRVYRGLHMYRGI